MLQTRHAAKIHLHQCTTGMRIQEEHICQIKIGTRGPTGQAEGTDNNSTCYNTENNQVAH
eukprot:8491469-Ditylum_brightwellii.AAC.1